MIELRRYRGGGAVLGPAFTGGIVSYTATRNGKTVGDVLVIPLLWTGRPNFWNARIAITDVNKKLISHHTSKTQEPKEALKLAMTAIRNKLGEQVVVKPTKSKRRKRKVGG